MTGAMAYARNLGERISRAAGRLGLLARFSVLSLACLAVLGAYVARETGQQIRERAIAYAAEEAELVTRFAVAHQVKGVDLERPLGESRIAHLDEVLHTGYSSEPVVGVRIWSPTGRVAYSDETEMIGSRNH